MKTPMTPMQKLQFFISDGLDNCDESIKVSEIWEEIKKLLPEENKQKLINQLFIGKVSEIIGFEKTTELLKEAKETFKND